jgi:hypothetical protein
VTSTSTGCGSLPESGKTEEGLAYRLVPEVPQPEFVPNEEHSLLDGHTLLVPEPLVLCFVCSLRSSGLRDASPGLLRL